MDSGLHQPTDTFGVHFQSSTDNGATWSAPVLVDEHGNSPSIASTTAGLVISWTKDDCTSGEELDFCDLNIVFRTNASTDATAPWSKTTVYTAYKGEDRASQVAGHAAGGFGVAWTSERRRRSPWKQEPTIWFGSPELPGDLAPHKDAAPPPAVVFLEHFPIPSPKVGDAVTVGARVEGELAAKPVLLWRRNGLPQPEIVMSDETLEIFTAQLGTFDLAGTRVEYAVRVLDVNGNRMTSFTRDFRVLPEFVKRNHVLLVLDNPDQSQVIQVFPYFRDALDANGIGFDVWNTARFGPPFLSDLVPYKDSVVIWSIPHRETWLLDHPEREIVLGDLATFLSEGGSLFLTSQQIGERLWYGSGTDRAWMRLNLHSFFVAESQSGPVFGVAGDPVGGNFTGGFGITGGDSINNYSPDEIAPRAGALAAFEYDTPTTASSAAGIRFESGSAKLIYLAFNFESINSSTTRANLMGDALAWINPTCNDLPSTIDGTPGDDVIFGTEGDDVIIGLGGRDKILAYGGNDTVCGGPDSDLIHGGDGNDWISGRDGVDFINGGAGQDVIYGDSGTDLILGGQGDDLIQAGPGNDHAAGGGGDDVIYGEDGDDRLLGGDGDDVIFGNTGDDTIKCEAGSDVAVGGPNTAVGDTGDLSCEVQFQIEN